MKDIYEEAAREWVARQIRGRGHKGFTRAMVRKPEFAIDEGWPGTDVTPGDDPEAALVCEIQHTSAWNAGSSGWHKHGERVYSVSDFLRQCSEIVRELDKTSPEGELRTALAEEKERAAEFEKRALATERKLDRIRQMIQDKRL